MSNCVVRAAGAMVVMVGFLAGFHIVCAINNICNSTPRHCHFGQRFPVQNSGGFDMKIELVSFDSRLQQFIKFIIVFVGSVLVIQVTKLLEVFLELKDAFNLVTLVTSLKMFQKLNWGFLFSVCR